MSAPTVLAARDLARGEGRGLAGREWLRGDTGVAAMAAASAVVLGTLPTVLALAAPPPGLSGFGVVVFVNDFAQYEAAMQEAARSGGWLVHNHFSPEPHAPAWMFPLYVAIGKLGALLGTGWEPLYRLVEVGARVGLAWALAAFVLRFAHPQWRRLGLVLGLFGAGTGFWAVLVQAGLGVPEPYPGNSSYEVNTFALFLGAPHTALGLAAFLAAVACLVGPESAPPSGGEARAGAGTSPAAGPGHAQDAALAILVLTVGLLNPFSLVPLTAIAVALTWLAPPGAWRRQLKAAAIALVVAAPFVVYHSWSFGGDPFWRATYGDQNALPSPRPWEIPVDLGVFLFGLVGVTLAWRQGGAPRRLALVAGVLLTAMYLPVPFQRRLGLGLMPVLAVLTTFTLAAATQWLAGKRRRWVGGWLRFGVVVAAVSTPVIVYGGALTSARTNAPMAVFRATPGLEAARAWLAAQANEADILVASWEAANYLGGRHPGRVVGGHPVATLNSEARKGQAQQLFRDQPTQEAIVRRERATLLVSADPAEQVFLEDAQLVFVSGAVRVFRVSV